MTKRKTAAMPASTMKQLVATLRYRLGRRAQYASKGLPGLTPRETYDLYDALCRATRAYGVRY